MSTGSGDPLNMARAGSATATFSGDRNAGLQIGQNFGQVQYSQPKTEYRGNYFNVAKRRSPNFTPRPQHQNLIEDQLRCEGSNREPKLLVISGLGGAGKSQLALNYLYQHESEYVATFWIEAESATSIERDFTYIFQLFYPGEQLPEIAVVISRVKAGLQTGPGLRLVVFDGADTIEEEDPSFIDLSRYLPELPGIHVILTTRISTAGHLSSLKSIQVKDMEDREALVLFQNASGIRDQKDAAEIIVSEVGKFALAITLAGCYLRENSDLAANLQEYVRRYREKREELLQWCPSNLIHQYGKSTLSTWKFSFDAIKRRSKLAVQLLTCLSFLNRNHVFLDLFRVCRDLSETRSREVLEPWKNILSPTQDIDIEDLKRAFQILVTHSFVDIAKDRYSMHQLIYDWGFDRLSTSEQEYIGCQIVSALSSAVKASPNTLQFRTRLIPHLSTTFNTLRRTLPTLNKNQKVYLEDLEGFDEVFRDAGQWNELLLVREYVYITNSQNLGIDHPDTIRAMGNLAITLHEQGNLREAAVIKEEVLEKTRKILGDDHPATILAMGNLATTLHGQGKLSEAAVIEEQVLEKTRKILGDDHPATITAMGNLAITLHGQGKLSEAAVIEEQVLEKRRNILGDDHPATITAMGNLAVTLRNQGKLSEAAVIEEQVLERRRNILGDDHPDTITAMGNLAATLRNHGKLSEAAVIEEQVLEKRRNILGDDHPDTILAMGNLAATLRDHGKLSEAAVIEEQVLEKRRNILGDDHPDTIFAMGNFAATLRDQGKLSEAAVIEEQVLEKTRNILGDDHPDTILAMGNLAMTLHDQGKLSEAAVIQEQVLEKTRNILGDDHPDTITAIGNLASTLHDQGKLSEAAVIEEQVIEKRRNILGDDHPGTITAMGNLAMTLHNQGKLSEAAVIKEQVLEKSLKILGNDHPGTITAMGNLASTLYGQGERDRAILLQQNATEMSRQILGSEHYLTIWRVNNLRVMLSSKSQAQIAGKTLKKLKARWQRMVGRKT